MIGVDARYGNMLHLPFSGGVLNQPMKTSAVFQLIQSLYREKLDKDQKQAMAQLRSQPRRH